MSEPIHHHYVSRELSVAGPALGRLGDHLCVAWTGTRRRRVNIMPVVDLADGRVGFDRSRKVTLRESETLGGPALAHRDHPANEVVVAWAINPGPGGTLSSIIGQGLDRSLATTIEVSSFDWSDHSPAMVRWGNEINVAWTGSSNGFLNVTPLVFSDVGWQFSSERKFTSSEMSPFEPALAAGMWPNHTIYLAWTGHDRALNIMHLDNPSPFVDTPPPHTTTFSSSTKRTFGETSDAGPAMSAYGRGIYLCWRGSGNENINVLHVGSGDGAIVGKDTSEHRTKFRPAIVGFRERLFVAWTGTDGALNLGQVNPYLPTTT